MTWLRKYWLDALVFGAIFAILMIDLNPDYTFVNKAADSIGYLYSAKYLYPSYHTSPPLYLLASHLFLMLPVGTDAWRMGLVSVFSTMGACVFIYLILKQSIPKKSYALLGVIMYGTSALVLSQSTVVQTYASVCLLAIGAYYFALSKKWKLMGLMIGMGLVVHILMGFVFIIMLMAVKEYRTNWKALAITLSFGVFYLYIPLTNRPPLMWFPDPNTSNPMWSWVVDTWSTIDFLIGKLAIWDVPKRVFDTIGIVGLSVGVIGVIPIVYYFTKVKDKHRGLLLVLSLFSIAVFISELDMNTYDYTMVSIPFLTIAACLGLYDLADRYWVYAPLMLVLFWAVILGIGVFNTIFFDIGRTLDSDMSAANLYHNEFPKIPDGAIFMPQDDAAWEAIYKYNADFGKHIVPVCKDALPSPIYQQQLAKDGVKLSLSQSKNMSVISTDVAKSVIALNDNAWTTVWVDPSTFGSKVVSANHDVSLVEGFTEETMRQIADNPQWKWKPSNPYAIITASICVTQWKNQLLSNYNLMFFTLLTVGGLLLNKLLYKIGILREWKRKKAHG